MKIIDIFFVIVAKICKQLKSNDKMKNIPGLDAKLQALFHFTSSILHRSRWFQPPSSNNVRLLPLWYLSNRVMGKLPEYNRTNDEQSEVNTKFPDF